MFPIPAGDLDELVEQHAPGHLACHPRVSAAHLFGVFFDAFLTHFHGWRHGVLFYEATEFSTAIRKIFSVSASMRQH
ncbi:MAG: hypothetical protein ACK459_11050, partial [Akkermansiaceae bacterium]